jgi:hypothetical protein
MARKRPWQSQSELDWSRSGWSILCLRPTGQLQWVFFNPSKTLRMWHNLRKWDRVSMDEVTIMRWFEEVSSSLDTEVDSIFNTGDSSKRWSDSSFFKSDARCGDRICPSSLCSGRIQSDRNWSLFYTSQLTQVSLDHWGDLSIPPPP